MNLATKIKTALAFLALTAVFGCGGGHCPGDSSAASDESIFMTLTDLEPCVLTPGQPGRVYSSYAQPPQSYTFPVGAEANDVVQHTNYADMTVPASAVSGLIFASRTSPIGSASLPYQIGVLVSVPEIEPNDEIDGSNSTPVGNNRTATGTLADPSDADHFTFGCLMSKRVRVTLTPPLVDTVFVNGTAIPLTAGSGVFTSTTAEIVVGLVGATGDYTLTITPA